MDYRDAAALDAAKGYKARAAMRRYRQRALDSDPAARAIKRLVRCQTWRAIVAMRGTRQACFAGAASGYAIP
jgi:hypothetical protein